MTRVETPPDGVNRSLDVVGSMFASWFSVAWAVAVVVGTLARRRRAPHAPTREVALAWLPPVGSLVALVVVAVETGSHPTHGDLLLLTLGALVIVVACGAGMRVATAARERARVAGTVALLANLGAALFWTGETAAVLLLNW